MARALRQYVTRDEYIPQTEKAAPNQVLNNAGGYTFEVTDEVRLTRFLILGTDSGTYYVSELDLTTQNVDWLRDLIRRDEALVLCTAVEVSAAGRAYRNDAAIFVLAMLLAEGKDKAATVAATTRVVRTATHAYQLAEFIEGLAGWGPAKVRAIRAWFASKSPEDLAYQAVKYRQRYGWTLRDLMRLSHPRGVDPVVGEFILRGRVPDDPSSIIAGFARMQQSATVDDALRTLDSYPSLPWETIPTQLLTDKRIWIKLFESGQLNGQALVRNITRMARLGAFGDMGFARKVADRLRDEHMIARTRLHPLQFLNAYTVYTEGTGRSTGLRVRRDRDWGVSPIIVDALDDGFGLSCGNIEPAGKRFKIAVDTSASMGWYLAGNTQLTCYEGAAAMALITARTEPMYEVVGFSHEMRPLPITARDSLADARWKVRQAAGGATDCSLPMLDALAKRQEIDTFVVITDNETWFGRVHPHKALEQYRQRMGIDARLVVVGMTATQFTVANPADAGMLDVVGFDTNTPRVLADFAAGRL